MQLSKRAVFFTCVAVLTLICLFSGAWNEKGHIGYSFPIKHFLKSIDFVIPSPKIPDKSMNEDRMKERISVKNMACSKLKDDKHLKLMEQKPTRYRPIILYTATYNMSYCGVGKAGGTLIKQLFSLIQNGEDGSRRYENISRHFVHRDMNKFVVQFPSKDWKHARLITVGRNPYTRLLSAFVDRVYLPSTTAPIRKDSRCRYDVTFEEFLRIVINNTELGHLDPHWSPIYYICRSCNVPSTFIVKQETFTDDLQFVAEALELPVGVRAELLRKLTKDRTTWTIQSVIKEQMGTARGLITGPKCIGWFGEIKEYGSRCKYRGTLVKTSSSLSSYTLRQTILQTQS